MIDNSMMSDQDLFKTQERLYAQQIECEDLSVQINVEFYVNIETPREQLQGIDYDDSSGDYVHFSVYVPEVVLESLSPSDLIEFIGVDSEFLIALEPEY